MTIITSDASVAANLDMQRIFNYSAQDNIVQAPDRAQAVKYLLQSGERLKTGAVLVLATGEKYLVEPCRAPSMGSARVDQGRFGVTRLYDAYGKVDKAAHFFLSIKEFFTHRWCKSRSSNAEYIARGLNAAVLAKVIPATVPDRKPAADSLPPPEPAHAYGELSDTVAQMVSAAAQRDAIRISKAIGLQIDAAEGGAVEAAAMKGRSERASSNPPLVSTPLVSTLCQDELAPQVQVQAQVPRRAVASQGMDLARGSPRAAPVLGSPPAGLMRKLASPTYWAKSNLLVDIAGLAFEFVRAIPTAILSRCRRTDSRPGESIQRQRQDKAEPADAFDPDKVLADLAWIEQDLEEHFDAADGRSQQLDLEQARATVIKQAGPDSSKTTPKVMVKQPIVDNRNNRFSNIFMSALEGFSLVLNSDALIHGFGGVYYGPNCMEMPY